MFIYFVPLELDTGVIFDEFGAKLADKWLEIAILGLFCPFWG